MLQDLTSGRTRGFFGQNQSLKSSRKSWRAWAQCPKRVTLCQLRLLGKTPRCPPERASEGMVHRSSGTNVEGSSGNVDFFGRARSQHLWEHRGKDEKPLPERNVAKFADMSAGKNGNSQTNPTTWPSASSIYPDVNKPKEVATPEQCLTVDFGTVGDFKRRLFTYDNSDPPEGELTLDTHFVLPWERPVPRSGWLRQEKLEWVRTLQRLRRLHLLEWGSLSRRGAGRVLDPSSWPQGCRLKKNALPRTWNEP